MRLSKKYYDGFDVIDILFKNLDPKKMMKVLEAFAESDGVDAVEVIRCKDCKHSHKCGGDMMMRSASGGYIYCPLGADGYCSMGERKEE